MFILNFHTENLKSFSYEKKYYISRGAIYHNI